MHYYDIKERRRHWRPFNFIIGGRGIGKTFSCGKFMTIEEGRGKFLYIRNYDTQIKTAASELGNPFRVINEHFGTDIKIKKHETLSEIFDGDELIGAATNASRYMSLKSIDLSWVDYIFWDEFIEDRIFTFDQAAAVKSIQETCNRNRELEGREPVYCFLLSNSEKLNNPTLRNFELIPIIENMREKNKIEYNSKRVHLELPISEISELKANTALYEALSDNDPYKKMALLNDFANDSFYGIKKKNIKEYRPFLNLNELYIYKHKSTNRYYVCSVPASYIKKINTHDQLAVFKARYSKIFLLLLSKDLIDFESFTVKSAFEDILFK